jgi:hypothetical protein
MLKRVVVAALAATMLTAVPAAAGQGGDALREALYAGAYAEGIAALSPLAAGGDQEAKFGLGLLQMLSSIEGFSRALYRYGATTPATGPLGPVLGPQTPANPNPEKLTYEAFRGVLDAFVTGMDEARATLEGAGASGDYVVPVEPLRLKMDVDGDGVAEDSETLAAIIATITGQDPLANPGPPMPTVEPPPESTGGRQRQQSDPSGAPAAPEGPVIGFDRADAIWFAGYSEVFAIPADFLLAHDFSDFFNVAFHRFFPRAGLMMQPYSTGTGSALVIDPQTDTAIADLIAAIHTINWAVVEPDRLKRVLARAHAVTNYSRQDWDAILAETDDDHELIPSPRQTPFGPGEDFRVTDEKVAAWRATLDAFDKVLDGELLLPHWRFRQGFDLRAYFETATRTDVVMLLTGAGALPFLKDGPKADAETFRAANEAFGGNLIGFAFWFN